MLYIRQKVLICSLISVFLIFFSKTGVFADKAYDGKTGAVTASILNLRQAPNTTSKILAKIAVGEQVKIMDISKEWYKISYKNYVGWVSGQYVKVSAVQEKLGKVNVDVLRIRKLPNTTSPIVDKLQKDQVFQILETVGNWYRVKTDKGTGGWICSDYVSTVKLPAEDKGANTTVPKENEGKISRGSSEERPAVEAEEKPPEEEADAGTGNEESSGTVSEEASSDPVQEETSLGQSIVQYASSFIGIKYIYGGNTPEEGFDCSGFTKYVFSYVNINLERTAASQALQGTEASRDSLVAGDLVFFATSGSSTINHVGIYIGEGKFIHAPSTGNHVTITSLSDSYYVKTFATARRVF